MSKSEKVPLTDKEVSDIRRSFNGYKGLLRDIERWKEQILYLNTKIDKLPSGSPKPLPEGSDNYDQHWRSELFNELTNCTTLREAALVKKQIIEDFLKRLPEVRDQNIFNDLYFNNLQLSEYEVAKKNNYSKRGLQERVKSLIRKYWEY